MNQHDIELTKRVGFETGSHYLTETLFVNELNLRSHIRSRAQCISLVSQIWSDYQLPENKKHTPVDLFELDIKPDPGAELGTACIGTADTGIHADKLIIGLRGFKKDKVHAVYLLHELAHAIEYYLNNNESHDDRFSKTFVTLVNRYLVKGRDSQAKTWVGHFLANKRECEKYLREQIAKAGETVTINESIFKMKEAL